MPVCTQDPIEDIGHGVTIQRRYMDGRLAGVAYWHPRPDNGAKCQGWVSVPDADGWPKDSWKLESEKPLTLSPSLACRACGHHGFIRDGKWVPV
jgi:hypothetical protein